MFREALKRRSHRQLNANSIETYRSALRTGVQNGQVVAAVAKWSYSRQIQLHAAINWSYRNGEMDQAAAQQLLDAIPLPASPPRYVDKTPSEEEGLRLETQINQLASPRRELILLPLYLALRASEVLALSREDVERAISTKQLRVQRKGNKESLLACKPLLPLLRRLLKTPTAWASLGDLVGGNTHKARLNRLNRMVKRAAKAAGFDTHTHALRHLCATRLLRAGEDVRNIQELLDHASLSTTTVYLKADLSKLGDRLQTPPEPPPPEATLRKPRRKRGA